ncbi:hypothetical protein [Streptomyces lanatus]|uniref:Uncharacterized protein n=1 Tax=Streptomyces lanatus TaxID=66900 RepID=A0ABV1Y6H8_9ACTN|nr:hypothetical protein [Streptomyces lanatus]GHH29588.1 hypothetical protein GCM10018780_87850 [Streptomyces lanatus]
MGEPHSDGSAPGRRRVHRSDAVSGPEGSALEALLAALPEAGADRKGEQQAVAAFRAARDVGAHRVRTRRRDDWRPRGQRRAWHSVRAAVALSLASLTLSGVALAAIGVVRSSDDGHGDRRRSQPSATASSQAGAGTPAAESHTPGASAALDHQATAQDTDAHCRAYEAVKGRGKALDATAWRRLVEAAGGTRDVAAYCAEQLTHTAGDEQGRAEKTENAKKAEKAAKPTKPAKTTKPEKPEKR